MLATTYYNETAPTVTVDVLGTEYRVWLDVSKGSDPKMATCDGYCDYSSKRIVVCNDEDSDLEDFAEYRKDCIRHELVHAFMFESGIGGCHKWDVPGETHPEAMVEWIAMMFPKMADAFKKVGAL